MGGPPECQTVAMGVRDDCRHYSTRTVRDEVVQRCRVGANEVMPFACPEGCLFFEPRKLGGPGWGTAAGERPSA